jgi:hypothetical protein
MPKKSQKPTSNLQGYIAIICNEDGQIIGVQLPADTAFHVHVGSGAFAGVQDLHTAKGKESLLVITKTGGAAPSFVPAFEAVMRAKWGGHFGLSEEQKRKIQQLKGLVCILDGKSESLHISELPLA